MCCPNGLLFYQKSLDMGPIFVKREKSLEEGLISQKLQKTCKISHLWGRKALKNGSQFVMILKKEKKKEKQKHQISFFFFFFFFLTEKYE